MRSDYVTQFIRNRRRPVPLAISRQIDDGRGTHDRRGAGARRGRRSSIRIVAEADGKVASAKNPGKWPNLFAFRAGVEKQSENGEGVLPIRITLPDGTTLTSEQPDVDRALSKALGKNVVLAVTERGKVDGVQSSMPAGWSARAVQYNDGHVGVYAAVVQEGVIKRGDPVRVYD